jgi:hypothetical protein
VVPSVRQPLEVPVDGRDQPELLGPVAGPIASTEPIIGRDSVALAGDDVAVHRRAEHQVVPR